MKPNPERPQLDVFTILDCETHGKPQINDHDWKTKTEIMAWNSGMWAMQTQKPFAEIRDGCEQKYVHTHAHTHTCAKLASAKGMHQTQLTHKWKFFVALRFSTSGFYNLSIPILMVQWRNKSSQFSAVLPDSEAILPSLPRRIKNNYISVSKFNAFSGAERRPRTAGVFKMNWGHTSKRNTAGRWL